MRLEDIKDREKASTIAKLVPSLGEHDRNIGRLQRLIIASLVGAGFCLFGCIWAIASGGETLPRISRATFFGVGTICLLVFGWSRLVGFNATLRAGERAYLILQFKKRANEDVRYSAEEVTGFLQSAPESISPSGHQSP